MKTLHKYQKAETLRDLAYLLGYKTSALSYIIFKINEENKYEEFNIKKRDGSERTIKAPIKKLKLLQKKLASDLNDIYEEISQNNKGDISISHGFRRKHSIITNAKKHKKKRYVFNIDLKDFFPSINFGRVYGFFLKNTNIKLHPKIAALIAKIACHNNELPQGSPCSPVISNLIAHILDVRLTNLAKRNNCTYSRYADDLTFSTNEKYFPEGIAFLRSVGGNTWVPGVHLSNEIINSGFLINEKKTSMQFKISRQMTTGLTVNDKVNIRKKYYKQARSMCYSLFKNGYYFLGDEFSPPKKHLCKSGIEIVTDKNGKERIKGKINQLYGIINHIYHVKTHKLKNEDLHEDELAKFKLENKAITNILKSFLFYKYFFN